MAQDPFAKIMRSSNGCCALILSRSQFCWSRCSPSGSFRNPAESFGLSTLLASRQAQAGQVKLTVLGVPQEADIRHHGRSDCAQPNNDLSGVIHATHTGVAGGEMAMR